MLQEYSDEGVSYHDCESLIDSGLFKSGHVSASEVYVSLRGTKRWMYDISTGT